MTSVWHTAAVQQFPPEAFDRVDESSDADFYAQPRLVNHIDDYAIAAVGEAYRRFLPPDGDYLDLMSSWVSHYPEDLPRNRIVGHGMNVVELAHNPALSEYWVQDLNADPVLPRADAEFDGVTICVSVQYLTRPVEVFAEIARVLKPGCPLVVAFSNRCFPTKAVAAWRYLDDQGHAELVAAYAKAAGGFDAAEGFDLSPRVTLIGVPEAMQERVKSGAMPTDPLFVVVARRSF
jgi:SAM-dependent methyltransferase